MLVTRIKPYSKQISFAILFLFLIYVYYNWTKVTTREIIINTEELSRDVKLIDTIHMYQFVPNSYIKLVIPFSMVDTGFCENYSHQYYYDTLRVHDMTPFLTDSTKNDYIDSLCSEMQKRIPISHEDKMPYLYNKIELFFDNWLTIVKEGQIDTLEKICIYDSLMQQNIDLTAAHSSAAKRVGKYINKSFEAYLPVIANYTHTETYGALSMPNWLSKSDISQFYFKLHIETHTIRTIDLNLSFWGANDFTFIKEKPTSITGQELIYKFVTDTTNWNINKDIILHVHSKELASIQNARIFFLTALISALIALALRSLIKMSSGTENKKKETRHVKRRYKSKKRSAF